MSKKILIALIFIIPIFAYYIISSSKNVEINYESPENMAKIIKFSSSMCLDCQNMSKIFNEVYPEYSDKVFLIDLNIQNTDKNTKKMFEKYGVSIVPTMIFMDKNSTTIKRVEGYVDKKALDMYFKELTNG